MGTCNLLSWNVQRAEMCKPEQTREAILSLLRLAQPGVFLLQEYSHNIKSQCKSAYSSLGYIQASKLLASRQSIELEILVNEKIFEVVDVQYISYSDIKHTVSPHGALIVTLIHHAIGEQFRVVTTHLTAKQDWRARKIQLERVFRLYDNDKVIIAGDFNTITTQDKKVLRALGEQYPAYQEATNNVNRTYYPQRIDNIRFNNRIIRFLGPLIYLTGYARKLDRIFVRGIGSHQCITCDPQRSDHIALLAELIL